MNDRFSARVCFVIFAIFCICQHGNCYAFLHSDTFISIMMFGVGAIFFAIMGIGK